MKQKERNLFILLGIIVILGFLASQAGLYSVVGQPIELKRGESISNGYIYNFGVNPNDKFCQQTTVYWAGGWVDYSRYCGSSGCKTPYISDLSLADVSCYIQVDESNNRFKPYCTNVVSVLCSCPSGVYVPNSQCSLYDFAVSQKRPGGYFKVRTEQKEAPPCDIGAQCKKEYKESICQGNSVYRSYEVYKYNSNCECVYSSEKSEHYESCDYQCLNGACVQGECRSGQTKCTGYDYYLCENNEWNNKGIIIGECSVNCKADSDCSSNEECSNYQCIPKGVICSDDCLSGETKCVGHRFFNCGNFDFDTCLEWSDGEILIGECGVNCKADSDCSSNEVCSEYRCIDKNIEPEPEPEPEPENIYLYILLGIVVIAMVGTLYWYFKK